MRFCIPHPVVVSQSIAYPATILFILTLIVHNMSAAPSVTVSASAHGCCVNYSIGEQARSTRRHASATMTGSRDSSSLEAVEETSERRVEQGDSSSQKPVVSDNALAAAQDACRPLSPFLACYMRAQAERMVWTLWEDVQDICMCCRRNLSWRLWQHRPGVVC